ncbi:MAG TPA: HEAT repeat domain-containing protein [Planctomycetota bacterium]|nr:HEAT repeat domain-containing protein [Planctomycetota bacterium]
MSPPPAPPRGALLCLLAALGASVSGTSVHAQDSAAAAPDDGAVTVVGTGLLRRSRAVVRACVEKVSTVSVGVEIATAKVEETLWGEAPPGDRVRVLTHEAGYFARVSPDAVLFLDPVGEGRYACRGVVDLIGDAGPAKLAALRRCLEIEALPPEKRGAALRAVCFEGLGAKDAWTRRNAARETAHLASVRPGAFTEADAREVRRAAGRERDRVVRPLLVEAAASLDRAAAESRLAPPDPGAVTLRGAALLRRVREDPDPAVRRASVEGAAAEGRAGTDAVREALARDADAGVRGAAAIALGQAGVVDAVPDLVRTAWEDGDTGVRAAAAEALGTLRAESAVPSLRGLGKDASAAVAREALFALARIRSEDALAAVRAVRAEAAAAPGEEGGALRDLCDFLLSDDFLRQEEALRRLRGGK